MTKKLKTKVVSKSRYKGVIDGKVMDLYPGDEFHCSPNMALKLMSYYSDRFDVIAAEQVVEEEVQAEEVLEEQPPKKKHRRKKIQVEDKSVHEFDCKEDKHEKE